MRVLVVGGGGREHALVHSFAQSPLADRIFCAPGNAGTAAEADNIPIAADDLPALLDFASREEVDLTVIGPEAPLVVGLTDLFEEHGLAVFGPNKEASQLEGSKVFAKEVMADGGVATGAYRRHERLESALADVEGREDYPLVVKADGLAAGKGVLICKDKAEAREAVHACFVAREFGDAGDVLITEEYLTGSEVSLLVLCDGTTAVPLAPAQDYKRIFAGDQGPNTGGMGSYCPVPGFEQKAIDAAMEHVVDPVVAALRKRGVSYRGVLYAGLIVTDAGVKVLEFNVPLRRPRDAGGAAAARLRPPRALRRRRQGRARRLEGALEAAGLRHRRARLRRLPGEQPQGRRHHRPGRRRRTGRRDRLPRRHGAAGRAGRHGRRPRARGQRARRRLRRRPRARLRGRRQDRLRRHAGASRHRRASRQGARRRARPVPGRLRRLSRAARAGRAATKGETDVEETRTEVETILQGIQMEPVLVGIVMGSESDREIMEKAAAELDERKIKYEINVLSAHRDPDKVAHYAKTAQSRGIKVLIGGAGKAAALPGVLAAYTNLPVIGVPIKTSDLGGLDSLLSIVQMPPGVPVACVAINGARNAAILAAKILDL